MSSKKLGIILGFATLAAIVVYLLSEYGELEKENNQLRDALNSNNLISENIRKQLLELLEKHPHIDDDVKNELSQVAVFLGVQQEISAVFKLTKIIENLLKKLLTNDSGFSAWLTSKNRKRTVFNDYLEYASEQKIITKEDFHFISILKNMRNEEAHDLNVIKDKAKLLGAFIAGVSTTMGLYNLVKAKAKALN
jgi:hypothetical protein